MFTPRTVFATGLYSFWRDERGVHVAWGRFTGEVAITSFSSETGE
jgi:hypothetical protein